MLEQIARHAEVDQEIGVRGDLKVDEHHTVEDTAIVLGECFAKALGSKKGIERYGFALPMDDAKAEVLLDFGGRTWLEWGVTLKREYVGDFPTEMARHFFASFCQSGLCNLHILGPGRKYASYSGGCIQSFCPCSTAGYPANRRRDPFVEGLSRLV